MAIADKAAQQTLDIAGPKGLPFVRVGASAALTFDGLDVAGPTGLPFWASLGGAGAIIPTTYRLMVVCQTSEQVYEDSRLMEDGVLRYEQSSEQRWIENGSWDNPGGVVLAEDFETGNTLTGPWTRDTGWSAGGTYSLKSDAMPASGGLHDATLTVNLAGVSAVEFDWRLSGQAYLDLWIDGALVWRQQGRYNVTNTGHPRFYLDAGEHTIVWRHGAWDDTTSAHIDNLTFTRL